MLQLRAIIVIFSLLTSALFCEASQPELQARFNSFLDRAAALDPGRAKLGLRNGVASLVVAMKRRKRFDTFQEISRHQFTVQYLDADFFGKNLNVRYAYGPLHADAPTVLLHAGFVSDFESGAVGYFLDAFARHFPGYNIVILEGLSSGDFAQRNQFYTLGGLHEPYLIRRVFQEFWASHGIRNRQAVLIGGSSSSYSVIAAPTLINRSQAKASILGSFLISGHDSMLTVYRHFAATDEGKALRGDSLFTRIGFNHMARKYRGGPDESFASLLRATFESYRGQFEAAWLELYGKPNAGRTYEQWLDDLSLSKFVPHVDVPFYWLQAKNDPLPVKGEYDRFRLAAANSPVISGELREYGGHAGFDVVYGEKWLWDRIMLFAKTLF